jgi:hypothetical protein
MQYYQRWASQGNPPKQWSLESAYTEELGSWSSIKRGAGSPDDQKREIYSLAFRKYRVYVCMHLSSCLVALRYKQRQAA